jgi:hypothetical protein
MACLRVHVMVFLGLPAHFLDVDEGMTLALLHAEDFDMCFQDFMKALEIMEGLVEPDHRGIAELYPLELYL